MAGKVWTDDARGPCTDIIPQDGLHNLGSASSPWDTAYINNVVTSGELLPNNTYLSAENAAGSGTIPLIGADATDNTVINVITGKVGKFAVNKVTVGTFDLNSIDFPVYNLTDGADKNHSVTTYGSGTGYSLTATPAAITLGTSSPTCVLDKAGTYLLLCYVNLQYVGATFAANRTATLKLHRTNNTPADITGSSSAKGTNIVTTVSGTLSASNLPTVIYTTTNTNDIIVPYADVSVIPTAGSLQATEASIVAIRLY